MTQRQLVRYHDRMRLLSIALMTLVVGSVVSGCAAAGSYGTGDRRNGGADRGNTNGEMFDMVAMTPDGDQWTVRLRGETLWAAYSLDDRTDDLGTVALTSTERQKVWALVDAVGITKRRKGSQDTVNGYVLLRLRQPSDTGDEHDIYSAYVSRATEVESIVDLSKYLRALIFKYHKEKAVF
jgi:hypothetical protein